MLEEMEPANFKNLSSKEKKLHYLNTAKRALALWGYPGDANLTLLNMTENATYRVAHRDFNTIVMRVHRLDYAEQYSINTELSWILALRNDTELKLANPIKGLDGSYVQTIETPEMNEKRHVVCFSYVEGKAPRDSKDDTETIGKIVAVAKRIPNRITVPIFRFAAVAYDSIGKKSRHSSRNTLASEDVEIYQKLGEIAAIIHNHSRMWQPPEFYKRIEWNWHAVFGDGWNNFYGTHYRDIIGILKKSDVEIIDDCVFLMKKRIEAFGKSKDRYGMIHSDLRMSNLLKSGDEIAVLDFDDCGRGWYLYDIASIVGFMEHRSDLEDIIDIVVEAYRKKAILSEVDEREIPTFIMMKRIGLLQAIMYHLDNSFPGSGEATELTVEILAFYAKGTVVLARDYLKKYKDMPLPIKSGNVKNPEYDTRGKLDNE